MCSGGGRHSLNFCDVISLENLFRAWKRFRKGKRSKKEVAEFEFNLEENLFSLCNELIIGKWKPDPYKAFYVQDPKLRKIHKASVRDRVLYQALYQALYQVFDKTFIHDSFASRDDKGTHKGVERLEQFSRKVSRNYTQQAFVLKCDIRKFFDSIDHQVLKSLVGKRVHDEELLDLLNKIIDSFKVTQGKGLPLGNVTSQVFANIYLNELDQFCKHTLKTKYYIRYCDDFVIVHNSRDFLQECILKIQSFLTDNLRMELHPNKVTIRKLNTGTDFLGYVSLPHHKVLRTRTKRRMLNKIRKLKCSYEEGKITKEFLEQSMQSYLGMLSHCKSEKIKDSIARLFYD